MLPSCTTSSYTPKSFLGAFQKRKGSQRTRYSRHTMRYSQLSALMPIMTIDMRVLSSKLEEGVAGNLCIINSNMSFRRWASKSSSTKSRRKVVTRSMAFLKAPLLTFFQTPASTLSTDLTSGAKRGGIRKHPSGPLGAERTMVSCGGHDPIPSNHCPARDSLTTTPSRAFGRLRHSLLPPCPNPINPSGEMITPTELDPG